MKPLRELSIRMLVSQGMEATSVIPLRRRLANLAALCGVLLTGIKPAGAEDLPLYRGTIHSPAKPVVVDVRLDSEGTFAGRVVSQDRVPIAGANVQLYGPNPDSPRAESTDADGRFTFEGLSTGLFRVTCRGLPQYVRIWSAECAPPAAVDSLDLVDSPASTVRGQQPLCNLFCNEPIMIGVLVAAAIAIPLALHDSGDQADGS